MSTKDAALAPLLAAIIRSAAAGSASAVPGEPIKAAVAAAWSARRPCPPALG